MADSAAADKLRCVLYKYSACNYKVSSSDDVYLQKLISFLTCKDLSTTGGHVLARMPLCLEWVGHAADIWRVAPPHPSVASFALRLAGAAVGDARIFICWQNAGILDKFLSSLKLEIERNGFVTTAYINFLSELLEHDYGCYWIMETGVWCKLITGSVDSRNMQVCKESHDFINKLVVTLQSKNNAIGCRKIINHILEALRLTRVNSQGDALKEDDMNMVLSYSPYLCTVLEAGMIGPGETVAMILLDDDELESLTWHFIRVIDDELYLGKFLKILILRYFLFFKMMIDFKPPVTEIVCFKTKVFDIVSYLSAKRYVKSILYLCFECLVYFHKFNIKCAKYGDKSKQCDFKDQLLLLHTMPIMCYETDYNTTDDCFLWNFMQKLFELISEDTIRLAYPLKDYLMLTSNKLPEIDYTKCSLIYTLELKNYLSKEQAAIVCQTLIYLLKNVVISHLEEYVAQHSDILSMTLDGLSSLLDHFHISWQEGAECVGLFQYVELLLRCSSLPSNVVVKAMRLMQVTVQNYLPPNLALLVNTIEGSIQELGPLLHRRLHDPSWDVRDSALELLHTVADISHNNFPAFQEHIMENGLCSVVVSLAMDDGESYVRASALKCLGAMLKVPRYWDDCLGSQDLPTKTISILTEESEGIVRREAALLMKELYQHRQSMLKSLETGVFAVMASAATCDLYWEVKVNALCFWEKVIEQQMSHQGMIDGRFPAMTFSRENRKIVVLTQSEVKSRINKVLEELGHIGCLQVLLSAIYDCDLQVVFKAVAVTTSLSSLLSQYGILPASNTTSRDVNMCMQHVVDDMQPNGKLWFEGSMDCGSDQVIENIVNESDVSLLSHVCHSRAKLPSTLPKMAVVPMKVEDFLLALSAVNLQELLSERTEWAENNSESLTYLLDDILFSHNDSENVITDCY